MFSLTLPYHDFSLFPCSVLKQCLASKWMEGGAKFELESLLLSIRLAQGVLDDNWYQGKVALTLLPDSLLPKPSVKLLNSDYWVSGPKLSLRKQCCFFWAHCLLYILPPNHLIQQWQISYGLGMFHLPTVEVCKDQGLICWIYCRP